MSVSKYLDISTLAKVSRGVEDVNGNGIFDEGDILKGYSGGCGAAAKDACGCGFWDGDFVLTSRDTATDGDMEYFLYRALHRSVDFFTVENKYGDDRYYAAISRQGCDSDELEYVVRIKAFAGHRGDQYGYGERDEFIYTFEPGTNMKTWLASADQYLSK